MRRIRGESEPVADWLERSDGLLAPRAHSRQGVAVVRTHDPGWTSLSFWDRSVESRGGSSSTFALPVCGLGWDELLEAARDAFPEVWERFSLAVEAETP